MLENDLMTERHTAEALTQEVSGLKSILAGTRNHTTGHGIRNTNIEAADDASMGIIDTEIDTVSYTRANENDTESEADYSLTDDAASDDEEDDENESR